MAILNDIECEVNENRKNYIENQSVLRLNQKFIHTWKWCDAVDVSMFNVYTDDLLTRILIKSTGNFGYIAFQILKFEQNS